jgi:UMF1 family MFS transporter
VAPVTDPDSTRAERFAWCLYDFANSAFPTVIVTAVYVLYFKQVVVGGADGGRSDQLWGIANSAAAAVVFALAPVLGAVADLGGRKRRLLAATTLLCVVTTAGLALTGAGTIALAMTLFILAAIGFETSCVIYNAFLPDLVPDHRMGRLSGGGWALGYVGGLLALLACLPLTDRHLNLVPLLVAAWYLVFAIPALAVLRDRPATEPPSNGHLLAGGFARLCSTLGEIVRYRELVRFLIAYFVYNNAVVTVIVFAVAFSTDSLGFSNRDSILLIVLLNVVAAPGALVFGWIADRIGARSTLVVTLLSWLVVVAGAELAAWPDLLTPDGKKEVFWAVAALAALCIGAIQATSRSLVGQMAPAGRAGEFYGFMAFTGKGSAILGPLVFGLASLHFGQRVAVATIGGFFLVGLVLLLRVGSRSS